MRELHSPELLSARRNGGIENGQLLLLESREPGVVGGTVTRRVHLCEPARDAQNVDHLATWSRLPEAAIPIVAADGSWRANREVEEIVDVREWQRSGKRDASRPW